MLTIIGDIFHVNNYWCNNLSSEKVESPSINPQPVVSPHLCPSSSGPLSICLVWGEEYNLKDRCTDGMGWYGMVWGGI